MLIYGKGEVVKFEEKVILFPKWQIILEKESLNAMKEKNYKVALKKLNKLLSFGVNKHGVMFGKLICLAELDHFEEAQELCETLLKDKNEHYYNYLHMYLTILFQTSQYDLLIEQGKQALTDESLPQEVHQQIQQLYTISQQMKMDIDNEKSKEYINDLAEAIKNENY